MWPFAKKSPKTPKSPKQINVDRVIATITLKNEKVYTLQFTGYQHDDGYFDPRITAKSLSESWMSKSQNRGLLFVGHDGDKKMFVPFTNVENVSIVESKYLIDEDDFTKIKD